MPQSRRPKSKPLIRIMAWICLTVLMAAGCSSVRHVEQGSYLLDKVSIRFDSLSGDAPVSVEDLEAYLRQVPNHRMLWSLKFRLGVYNMSGRDSTRFLNRLARRLGEPPVIYDSLLTHASAEQLRKTMANQGYLHARVQYDTLSKGKKMQVTYRIDPGEAFRVDSLMLDIADPLIAEIVRADSLHLPVLPGAMLDRAMLERQRDMVTERLRNRGYYGFSKENITFSADTTEGSTDVQLTMRIAPVPGNQRNEAAMREFDIWAIRRVICIPDYDPAKDSDITAYAPADSVEYKGITILYGPHRQLRPSVIYENTFLRPGELFEEKNINRTYQAFSRLSILKFINVRTIPVASIGDLGLVDAYILLTPGKSMNIALELEGTNSEGDLGVAAGLTFTHRNLRRGSEALGVKVQGSYEALSGHLEDLIHNRYLEYAGEMSLTFPKFKAPFLSERFRRRINASSALNLSVNFQERPEYTRVISAAGWSYKWTDRNLRNRQTLTPIDINYVYLPRSTYDFLNKIAPDNPLLRYSYEDHFIMRLGYSMYATSRRTPNPWEKTLQRSFYTFRSNIETAGNLLFGLSNLFDPGRNFRRDPYRVFNIRYSQYVKIDADYAYMHVIGPRNSVAFHIGAGIGIPYANSTILPFEKRFYGGGANGVRGWAVRTLGPGSYPGVNSVSDFINQCGDIRLEFNVEYRAKLFWVIELGAFVDAGNIWTIRDYENQPGGVFEFDRFYKQLAAAYGLGLRLDFSYFLLRFDLGMKARNPARGQQHWPLLHPRWHRDSSFHFSIGYPF